MLDVLVYSAVVGDYDEVREPLEPGRYLLITDGRAPGGWIEQKEPRSHAPQRTARFWKTKGTPQADYTIWLDGNVQLTIEPRLLVQKWLIDNRADIALFKHPGHDCIYQEARQCKKKMKDQVQVIDEQMKRYRHKSFPSRFGLGETTVIARRNTAAVRRLNSFWWSEIERGSVRDQLSFDYVRWLMGKSVKVHFVDGGHRWKRREHPFLVCWPHEGKG